MSWSHEAVERSGLLDGPLGDEQLRAWPAAARAHLAGCAACLGLVAAERRLRQALQGRRTTPAHPSISRAIRAPDLDALFPGLPAFPRSTLTLERTKTGVCARDPEAGLLLVFRRDGARLTPLDAAVAHGQPGVAREVALPAEPLDLLAISTRRPVEPALLQLWLEDALREGPLPCDARIGLATLRVAPTAVPEPLPTSPLPRADDAVAPWLADARAGLRAGRPRDALRDAWESRRRAEAAGDPGGLAEGMLLLAEALIELGHEDEAEQLLGELATISLDPARTSDLARLAGVLALLRADAAVADSWLEHARMAGPGDATDDLDLRIARLRRDWRRVRAVAERRPSDLAAGFDRVVALVELGEPQAAAEAHARLPTPLERHARLAAAQAEQALAGRLSPRRWDQLAAGLCEATLSRRDAERLHDLACEAAVAGAPAAARALVASSLGHLAPPPDGLRRTWIAQGARGLLVADDHEVRRLRFTSGSWGRLIERVREQVLADNLQDELPVLSTLLLGDDEPTARPRALHHAGALRGAPLAALGLPLCEVTGPAHDRRPTVPAIASVADPRGDLPGAAAEIDADACALHLRGRAVRRDALGQLPPVGLLHLGLRVHREDELPVLELADGGLPLAELAELWLPAHPIALLSGCAVGPRGADAPLVSALLEAGAAAVLAPRWPLTDAEARLLVHALLRRWPFTDAARAAHEAADALRARGLPARVWASLGVYV